LKGEHGATSRQREQPGIKGTKFDVDTWDKKPVMDGIAVIRDITGFDFWIDETGGAIWRLPNIFKKGCYVMPRRADRGSTRTLTWWRSTSASTLNLT
jgi:hypothetical protein